MLDVNYLMVVDCKWHFCLGWCSAWYHYIANKIKSYSLLWDFHPCHVLILNQWLACFQPPFLHPGLPSVCCAHWQGIEKQWQWFCLLHYMNGGCYMKAIHILMHKCSDRSDSHLLFRREKRNVMWINLLHSVNILMGSWLMLSYSHS